MSSGDLRSLLDDVPDTLEIVLRRDAGVEPRARGLARRLPRRPRRPSSAGARAPARRLRRLSRRPGPRGRRPGRARAHPDRPRSSPGQPAEVVRQRRTGEVIEGEADALHARAGRRARCARSARAGPTAAARRSLPDRLQLLARAEQERIRPVICCLSRNDCASLRVSLAGSTEMPIDVDVGVVEVVERAADRLHLRRAGVAAGRVDEREHRRLAAQRGGGDVSPSWSVSVKSGTGWPGGRTAPAHPLMSSSPCGAFESRSASSTPATAAAAQRVRAMSASWTRAGSTRDSVGDYASVSPRRIA